MAGVALLHDARPPWATITSQPGILSVLRNLPRSHQEEAMLGNDASQRLI